MATVQLSRFIGRLVIAIMLSIAFNVVLLAVASNVDPRMAELTRIERWDIFLLSPAAALTAALVPGHSGAQIVAIALFSFAFYAALAWVAISLPVWWRTRLYQVPARANGVVGEISRLHSQSPMAAT